MTDENQEIRQEQKSKKYYILALAFLTSLVVTFTLFYSSYFSYKSSPIDRLIFEESSCVLPEITYQDIQADLEDAAAIYKAQQGVNPKIFSDFVVYEVPVTGAKTLSLGNYLGNVEGFGSTELKVGNLGTYHLKDIVSKEAIANYHHRLKIQKERQIAIQKDNIKQQKWKKEDNKRRKQFDNTKSFILFLLMYPLTFGVYFIFRFFNKKIKLILFYIFLICLIISILDILGGQIDSTVSTITKPAIYLYPKTPTKVVIKLDKSIKLTLDVPRYAPNKGWYVLAQPNGQIVDLQPQYTDCNKLDPTQFGMEYAKEACINNNYPYVYWEGDVLKNNIPHQTKGWLVKTTNVKEFLTSKLNYVGFNKEEKREFIRYWVHKIKELNKETVFISFMQTKEVEKYFPMTVTPTPESVNRFYIFIDSNVEKHQNPVLQVLMKFKRKGFTLVDWGGGVTE